MGKRSPGVTRRKRKDGKVYELYCHQGGKKISLGTVFAKDKAEAFDIREERRLNYFGNYSRNSSNKEYLESDFSKVWVSIEQGFWKLDKGTVKGIRKTYNRMFFEFREMKFSNIDIVGKLTLRFFLEYRNYYNNEIYNEKEKCDGRPKGWRAEIIRVKNIMSRMKNLDYCSRELLDDILSNSDLKTPRPKKLDNYIDIHGEYKGYLDCAKEEDLYYHNILYFIYWTGRRISESTTLEKKDVIRDKNGGFKPLHINIRREIAKCKEDDPDPEPLPLDWSKELRQHIERALVDKKSNKWLFPNRFGRKCTPNRVRDFMKKINKKTVGLNITPHQMRKHAVTEMKKNGMSNEDIKSITGHRDDEVINTHYSYTTKSGRKQAHDALKLEG
jgi:integrase